jgi:hypothetical protein
MRRAVAAVVPCWPTGFSAVPVVAAVAAVALQRQVVRPSRQARERVTAVEEALLMHVPLGPAAVAAVDRQVQRFRTQVRQGVQEAWVSRVRSRELHPCTAAEAVVESMAAPVTEIVNPLARVELETAVAVTVARIRHHGRVSIQRRLVNRAKTELAVVVVAPLEKAFLYPLRRLAVTEETASSSFGTPPRVRAFH